MTANDEENAKEWRCFFCDEVFTSAEEAATHFGGVLDLPGCKLSAMEGGILAMYREAQRELEAYRAEDTKLIREVYALGAAHHCHAREEEEKGYARGLADGRAIASSVMRALNERDMLLNPSTLRRAADEIDCDHSCESMWHEYDTNASGCRRSERGDYCPGDLAATLRAFADAVEPLKMSDLDTPLTEEWLKEVGFKWHQLDRQPNRHWLLWLGAGLLRDGARMFSGREDLGIEVTHNSFVRSNGEVGGEGDWFCWLRDDAAGRYHRFIHLRHIVTRRDLVSIVVAITGRPWTPENHLYGALLSPEQAKSLRTQDERLRLDREFMEKDHPWSEVEKDDSLGGALPEHLAAHEAAKKAGD